MTADRRENRRKQSARDHRRALREALQSALPAAPAAELASDLWPRMLERFDQEASRARALRLRPVSWFDWALLGVAGAILFVFPAIIPALLYHL
jgi:hypothetical protein